MLRLSIYEWYIVKGNSRTEGESNLSYHGIPAFPPPLYTLLLYTDTTISSTNNPTLEKHTIALYCVNRYNYSYNVHNIVV